MTLAFHLVLCCYGFWLPNDPRGSWSEIVRNDSLKPFGHATKVNTRRSLANKPHHSDQRIQAKQALAYPPVRFNGEQAQSIAKGFAFRAQRSNLRIYACAIMPDHAHLVIANDGRRIEMISNQLKGAATRQLLSDSHHPLANHTNRHGRPPSPWAEGQWKVFITTPKQLHHTIQYVNQNPIKAGYKPQNWSFITPPQ